MWLRGGPTWGSVRWQRGLAAVITAVVCSDGLVYPGVGLDLSAMAGLALGRSHDLAWGPEIVFNVGPLGFLRNSAY